MKKRAKLILILCVIGVMLVSGCSASPNSESSLVSSNQIGEEKNSAPQLAASRNTVFPVYNKNHEVIAEIEGFGVLMQTDDSIIYTKVTATPSVLTEDVDYYRYVLETKEHIKLGSLEKIFDQTRQSILLDNHLYLYASSEIEFPDTITSRLLDIDLNRNTMTERFADEEGSSYNSMALAGNRILIAKLLDDGSELQEYNLETGELNSLMSYDFDMETNTGEAIQHISCDENTISLLMLKTQVEKTVELRLDTYDYDMNFLRTVDLSCVDMFTGEPDGNQLDDGVSNFVVKNNYVYYENFSLARFLGKIEGNSVSPVMETDDNFRIAPQMQKKGGWDTILFIQAFSPDNDLYLFDCRDGSVKRAQFYADDERYSIGYVERASNDSLMVEMCFREPDTGEKLTRLYELNLSDLDFQETA